jgi:glutamate N-acetyltransferase / amino-acid N-acetyltransferase
MPELHLLSPAGFKSGAVHAGIKQKRTADVGLLVCDTLATAAAVFTTNKVVAAPVVVGREHVRGGKLRAVVVNSGNANACTGARGLRDARRMCALAADEIGAGPQQVLPSSTGIIGHMLPMEKVEAGIRDAGRTLGDSAEHALRFADAILTTDLVRKSAATAFKIGRRTVRLAGVCKGSGMIGPRLGPPQATMLAYLTTDAAISPALLRRMLYAACDQSFNAVTVDNHTSTNDTAAILASGASGAMIDSPRARRLFADALREVCQSLAYQIAADGEGATKVLAITVREAKSESDARLMARAIADSPLVKCAMHGNDPNWGRIVSAAGMVAAAFDPDRATLRLQGTAVFRRGQPLDFDPAAVSRSIDARHVEIDLRCGAGNASATCWTCDLSKQYVTINADYHT